MRVADDVFIAITRFVLFKFKNTVVILNVQYGHLEYLIACKYTNACIKQLRCINFDREFINN